MKMTIFGLNILTRSGVRGKYANRFKEGSNVVVIDSDLSDAFPSSEAVNEALRDYLASQERAAT